MFNGWDKFLGSNPTITDGGIWTYNCKEWSFFCLIGIKSGVKSTKRTANSRSTRFGMGGMGFALSVL